MAYVATIFDEIKIGFRNRLWHPNPRISTLLKISIGLILAAWSCMWILKPTQLWKRSWHKAEGWADATILREARERRIRYRLISANLIICSQLSYVIWPRFHQRKRTPLITNFSNPVIANSPVGTISSSELIAAALFIIFLAWTYSSNVASDLKKMTPSKSLKLNRWQLKVMAIDVRFGSLTDACLALLFLPVLRGMALFALCGIQFEASVRYHVWIGNAIIFFSILHGTIIMCVWGSRNSLWEEVEDYFNTWKLRY